jgi:16S rRNA (guanine966-N2)-methyltransferase
MLKSIRDTLRPHFAESRVLDLYAGEGRFGSVALDEGACHVDFVEMNAGLANALREQAQKWAESSQTPVHIQVHRSDVVRYLSQTQSRYDIVFADPPFQEFSEPSALELTRQVIHVLGSGGIFLVKHPARMLISGLLSIPEMGLRYWKDSAVGDAGLTYFVRN